MNQFNLSDEELKEIEDMPWDSNWYQLMNLPDDGTLDIERPRITTCDQCPDEYEEKVLSKRPRDSAIPDNMIRDRRLNNFERHFEVSQAESNLWTPLARKVVKYSFAGYGFGCWERTLAQVEGFGINIGMLHRYVHNHTKLTRFDGYMGIRLDIDDLAAYNTQRLEEVNKVLKRRNEPVETHYTTPQLFYTQFWMVPQPIKEQQIRKWVMRRFALRTEEIALARGLFEKKPVPHDTADESRARVIYTFCKRKTVFDFTDYKYDNGHDGVYPLDTNAAGVMRVQPGTYHHQMEARAGGPAEDKDKWRLDMEKLAMYDSTFNRAYPNEPPYKRQRLDPPQDESAVQASQPDEVQPPAQAPVQRPQPGAPRLQSVGQLLANNQIEIIEGNRDDDAPVNRQPVNFNPVPQRVKFETDRTATVYAQTPLTTFASQLMWRCQEGPVPYMDWLKNRACQEALPGVYHFDNQTIAPTGKTFQIRVIINEVPDAPKVKAKREARA